MKCENVSRLYGAKQDAGFAATSLEFAPHQWTSILGPSGCGKSTLLRVLAGLENPTTGRVLRDNVDSRLGFVFQDPALLAWKTVEANIVLPLHISGEFNSKTHGPRLTEVLNQLDLAASRHLYPHQLSGGMKMRVSLARALITDPTWLLLDEPFAALDEPIRVDLALLLHRLFRERQMSVILVTHSITEATWLSNRILILNHRPGRVVLDETIEYQSVANQTREFSVRHDPQFQARLEKYFDLLGNRSDNSRSNISRGDL
jgi:NitT/TauT family transport system ATP-binding protein